MPRPLLMSFAAVFALALPATAADPLAAGLQEKATAVIAHAKKKGYANLGVLKFLVRKGADAPSDSVGDLNLSLANKTEVALILANTDEKFGIIDKASAFVEREKMTSANHLTADGRKAFFTRKYDLAWSRDKVEPAAFVTGLVTFSADLKTMTVKFQVFDKTGAVEELPGELTAVSDPETIAQAGYSYAIAPVRQKALVAGGPPPAPEVRRAEAVDGALKAAAPDAGNGDPAPFAPLADSPVRWKVLYNGKAVALNGNTAPDPGPDDRVEFVLSNPGPGTYAVVLFVNGENTLYQERSIPLACRKWVLPPGGEVTVRGFQTAADTTTPFRVLRPEEPEPEVVRYGPHAGTFRMVVYHGTMTTDAPKDDPLVGGPEAAEVAIARTRGATRPDGVKPQSLRALQADLRGRAKAGDGARGYVVKGGSAERFETESVYFTPSADTPVADVSLRYAAPKK